MKLQFFDLDSDLQEQYDVVAQHPDIIKQTEETMKKEHHTPGIDASKMETLENN